MDSFSTQNKQNTEYLTEDYSNTSTKFKSKCNGPSNPCKSKIKLVSSVFWLSVFNSLTTAEKMFLFMTHPTQEHISHHALLTDRTYPGLKQLSQTPQFLSGRFL